MCVVAVKFFSDAGWVGVKNRDRNYKPQIKIKQSFRKDIERLYIWDEKTKYTEGVNEYGIAIISAAVAVKKDEKEGGGGSDNPERIFYSPDGKKIRTALFEKTVESCLKKLIEMEIPGNTFVFSKDKCFLLEGAFKDTDGEEYEYVTQEIKKDQVCVRTNHGIHLEYSGYQADEDSTPEEIASRRSSEERLRVATKGVKECKHYRDMLDAISSTANKNPQLNPLRIEKTHGASIMQTTGQLMIIPGEKTLHYRPIWSEIDFDFNKIDHPNRVTSFEVVSSKKLMSFSKFTPQK